MVTLANVNVAIDLNVWNILATPCSLPLGHIVFVATLCQTYMYKVGSKQQVYQKLQHLSGVHGLQGPGCRFWTSLASCMMGKSSRED